MAAPGRERRRLSCQALDVRLAVAQQQERACRRIREKARVPGERSLTLGLATCALSRLLPPQLQGQSPCHPRHRRNRGQKHGPQDVP